MAYVELIFLYLLLKHRQTIVDMVLDVAAARSAKKEQEELDEFVYETLKPGAGLEYVPPKNQPKLRSIRGGKD